MRCFIHDIAVNVRSAVLVRLVSEPSEECLTR